MLIHPYSRKIAIRPADKNARNAIVISKSSDLQIVPKQISTKAFSDVLFNLMGWKKIYRYRIFGNLLQQDGQIAYVFDGADAVAFLSTRTFADPICDDNAFSPLTKRGDLISAIPEKWTDHFGMPYYQHEQTIKELTRQTEKDWKLRLQGNFVSTGNTLNVTPFEELRRYIQTELEGTTFLEEPHE